LARIQCSAYGKGDRSIVTGRVVFLASKMFPPRAECNQVLAGEFHFVLGLTIAVVLVDWSFSVVLVHHWPDFLVHGGRVASFDEPSLFVNGILVPALYTVA